MPREKETHVHPKTWAWASAAVQQVKRANKLLVHPRMNKQTWAIRATETSADHGTAAWVPGAERKVQQPPRDGVERRAPGAGRGNGSGR